MLEKLIHETNLNPAFCALRHITSTSRLVVAAFDAALRPTGLTGHQFNVLMTLIRNKPMNVNGLSAAVGMHPSTTPRLVAPLAQRGLVCTRVGTDRRERLIGITKKGRAQLIRAFPRWAEVQQKIVGEEEQGKMKWSATLGLLRNIRKALRQ